MIRSLLYWLFIGVLLLAACGPQPTLTETASPPPVTASLPVESGEAPENLQSTQYPPPQASATPPPGGTPYPPPGETAYPPPGDTPYPPPGGTQAFTPASPARTNTPGLQQPLQPSPTTPGNLLSSPTPRFNLFPTGVLSGTVVATPTERPISTAMPPPGGIAQTITIWHSWSADEAQVLEFVLKNFQDFYPDVAFDVLYVPHDELFNRYEMAAYRGKGPGLLFGPAEWGPLLYEKGLVADLSQDADPRFLAEINPAALQTAYYRGALTGLPHRIRRGILLFRNRAIVSERPDSWDEFVSMSVEATRGGKVGAYLEHSFLYSAGHLYGLGGRLMDEAGNPAFNTPQGVEWLNLLASFEKAGPVEFNANRDLDLFKVGRVGMIIDGSWNLDDLLQAVGEQNLVIDPWPTAGNGRLSGFVQADNVFLNANLSGGERYASLLFVGYMMAREVQSILSRAGHIPSVLDVDVEDLFMRQAMTAFESAVPYPGDPALAHYWDPLEAAMLSVFDGSADPQEALRNAEAEIR